MKILNIACGSRISPDTTHTWENIDFSPLDNRVKKVNLLKRLPFSDNSFDVAYSSHFLEHLSKDNAIRFLSEVKRVLKVGGIVRIVVPDLENAINEYIKILNLLKANRGGQNEYILQYDWILVELFDQMIRMKSGGEMGKILDNLADSHPSFQSYILERVGHNDSEAKQISFFDKLTLDKIGNKALNMYLRCIRLLIPKSLRDEIFIQTSIGERHKWAYDEFSLTRILQLCGFVDCKRFTFNTSQIPEFHTFYLDNNKDSTAYKGSSLYMECKKS